MNLDRRLRMMERGTAVRVTPGSPTAAQREAQRTLREHPDLLLVTREDCDPDWGGDSVFNSVWRLRLRAQGDHPRAELIANVERDLRAKEGLEPEVPAERLFDLALRAALHARARVALAEREKAALERGQGRTVAGHEEARP